MYLICLVYSSHHYSSSYLFMIRLRDDVKVLKPHWDLMVLCFSFLFSLQSSYGFVDYLDHRYAAIALTTLNGRQLYVPVPFVFVRFLTDQ